MKKINLISMISVILMVAFDQITKYLIATNMFVGDSFDVIGDFFSIHYVQNTGAGFSILEGKMTFFYAITIFALCFLFYLLFNNESDSKIYHYAILMMIGGTFGNFIDRIFRHYVVDFLDFVIFGYDFPVFNVADCFLTIGVILFVLVTIYSERVNKNADY